MWAIIPLLLVGFLSSGSASEESNRDARIFAFYSTTSQTRLTTTTITGLYTCLSTTTTPACLGRKKRMFLRSTQLGAEDLDEDGTLNGSLEETGKDLGLGAKNPDSHRQAKKLTIWSTAFSTITITSTSVLAGTTVSASALCAAPGLTAGCFVG
ncbi:uncharacterized protein LOC135201622 [Macrobrachium nipponense]|uniref:uncharacterized protein LOC135201622 n=1 Tax=Macrobrachium nipponense TaxID=159736 RepID=UPI0030C82E0B